MMVFHLRLEENNKYNNPNPTMEPMIMWCVLEGWVLFSVHAFNLQVILFD